MVRLCLDLVKTKMAQQQKGLKNSAEVSTLSSKLQAAMAHPEVRFDASVHKMPEEMRKYIAWQKSMNIESIYDHYGASRKILKIKPEPGKTIYNEPKKGEMTLEEIRKKNNNEADHEGYYHWEHARFALEVIMGIRNIKKEEKEKCWGNWVIDYVREYNVQIDGYSQSTDAAKKKEKIRPSIYYFGLVAKYLMVKEAQDTTLKIKDVNKDKDKELQIATRCVENFLTNRWLQIYHFKSKSRELRVQDKKQLMKGFIVPLHFKKENEVHWSDWARLCFFMTSYRGVILKDMALWWQDIGCNPPAQSYSGFNQDKMKIKRDGKVIERDVSTDAWFSEDDRKMGIYNYAKYVQSNGREQQLLSTAPYKQLYDELRGMEELGLSDHMTVSEYAESMRVCNRFQINL